MQRRPFETFVAPRVQEAFGGKRDCDRAILRLYNEFRATDTEKEQCAIIGAPGSGDHAYRIWTSHGDANSIEIPFSEMFQIMSADTSAFQYGWVFAHTHKIRKSPSSQDNEATCAIAWLASLLDLPLVDHWIFTLDIPHLYSYSKSSPEYLSPSIRFEVERED